jgi:hypothetical protein
LFFIEMAKGRARTARPALIILANDEHRLTRMKNGFGFIGHEFTAI